MNLRLIILACILAPISIQPAITQDSLSEREKFGLAGDFTVPADNEFPDHAAGKSLLNIGPYRKAVANAVLKACRLDNIQAPAQLTIRINGAGRPTLVNLKLSYATRAQKNALTRRIQTMRFGKLPQQFADRHLEVVVRLDETPEDDDETNHRRTNFPVKSNPASY